MSKIGKSDSLFSLGERIWKYKDCLVLGIGFISSFFAPVALVFGWPATIVIITSLLSSSVFLLLSFWKKFNDTREIKKEERIGDIKLNRKRAKEVDGILIRATNSNPVEKIKFYNQAMILIRDFSEIKKQTTIEIAKTICGKNVTQEQQSTIYTLLEEYEPFRDKINKLLATKGLEAIKNNQLSKQSVEFLSSITDKDLEILKKQFKYVLQLPHQNLRAGLTSKDLAIWRFENNDLNVQDVLLEETGVMHLESYHIKFYGDIWMGENARVSSHTPKNQQENLTNIDPKSLNILQINIKNTKLEKNRLEQFSFQEDLDITSKTTIIFSAYVCLSEIGTEVFNLLKDELEPVPSEYLNELILYWNKINPEFDLKLISESNFITNDNF